VIPLVKVGEAFGASVEWVWSPAAASVAPVPIFRTDGVPAAWVVRPVWVWFPAAASVEPVPSFRSEETDAMALVAMLSFDCEIVASGLMCWS
jgi:hypothetical protein